MEEKKKSLIVEASCLDLEDLKQSKFDGGERNERGRETYSLHKEPTGCISPPELNPIFVPQCHAESRGVIQNLILVGTIIMLVV